MAQESWRGDKEETQCQAPEEPGLCSNNCGFFASSATMNMCSKCYRATVLKQAKAPGNAGETGSAASLTPITVGAMVKASESEATDHGVMKTVTAPSAQGTLGGDSKLESRSNQTNRCFTCKKRVGLTGFKCRCDNVFCSLHRHSDKHVCSYDYKAAGRDAIAKANPIVKAGKIDKI